MTVTESDIRENLNNITTEELAAETIVMKIADAELIIGQYADSSVSEELKDFAIKAWASWKSFVVSKSYSKMKMGDLSASREIKMIEERLKQEAEDALSLVAGSESQSFTVVSGDFTDDRPETEDKVERGLYDGTAV